MAFTRHSKIKDIWYHPVGHDLLLGWLQQHGRNEKWPDNPLVANLPIAALDRIAGSGFVDVLLDLTAFEPDITPDPGHERHTWWKEAVIYQIFPPSFMDSDHDGVGDLGGVLQRLPYLERLGVNTLWLQPLFDLSHEGGTKDYKAIYEELGDMEDFETLLEAAHTRNMRVIASVDIHATSDQHPWFCKALQSEKEYQDYYFFRPGPPEFPPNNWTRPPTGSAWRWFPEASLWCLRTSGRSNMDLNWDNPAVRAEMAEVLRFWIDKGLDGFFFTCANFISKTNLEDGNLIAGSLTGACGSEKYIFGPRLHRYLKGLRAQSMADSPVLAAGTIQGIGSATSRMLTGDERHELDMVLDTSHLIAKPRGRNEEMRLDLQDLRKYYLRWMAQYNADKWMAIQFETANTPRLISRVGANPVYRSILAKLLGTWMLTMRGTPVLYQGQELGLPNTRFRSADELKDAAALRMYADLRERQGDHTAFQKILSVTADHARTPLPWNSGPNAGFTGALPWIRLPDGAEYLNAAVQMEDPGSVLRHYQVLLALRKQHACLVYGSFNPVFGKNKKLFCYFRIVPGEKWYVEMNLTEKEIARPGRILRTQKLMLSNYDTPAKTLRPYEANLYYCE